MDRIDNTRLFALEQAAKDPADAASIDPVTAREILSMCAEIRSSRQYEDGEADRRRYERERDLDKVMMLAGVIAGNLVQGQGARRNGTPIEATAVLAVDLAEAVCAEARGRLKRHTDTQG